MNQCQQKKPFDLNYDQNLEAMVLIINDTEGLFPLYLQHPKAGRYKIIQTKPGNLQMVK